MASAEGSGRGKAQQQQQPPWFIPEVPEPPAEFRAMLESRGIQPTDVRQHIQTVVCHSSPSTVAFLLFD